MKKIAIVIGLAALAVAACKPEIKPIGPRYRAGEGMPGTWELSSIKAIDITLPVPEERDQSMMLKEETNRLILTFAETGNYTVDQRGIVPNIFGTQGTWMFDRLDFPTMMYIIPDVGDTLKVDLLSMPRQIDNTMGFGFTRNRCDKDYVTLEYSFIRK